MTRIRKDLKTNLFTWKQTGLILALFSVVGLGGCVPEKHPIPQNKSTHPLSEAVIQDWKNQKFSMFIHFGLYSIPGGMWNGQQITIGYSEQIRAHGRIPKADYRKLAAAFNPTNWNPDSIALLAKSAGMRSIVITAKHHDGFALFKTKYSSFNSVDGTPYKRDLIDELAKACKRHQLRFGVYFSLIDWDFDGALPISNHNSDSIPAAHHRMNMGQVEELMSNYGPISEIWFDMGKLSLEQSADLAQLVRKLQPNCLISGRIWNDQGDFAVMGDNASPDFRMGTPWQTPASMFDETWGYRSWQIRKNPEEKALEKLRALINTNGNGGNYLLNIGPMGDGAVVPFEKDVLETMGTWIKKHEPALKGKSLEGPLQPWGTLLKTNNSLHLFILKKPAGKSITVNGLMQNPVKATILHHPEITIKTMTSLKGLELIVSKEDLKDIPIPVIQLDFDKEPELQPEGVLTINAIYKPVLDQKNAIAYHSYSGKDYYSTKPTTIRLEWNLRCENELNSTLLLSVPENTIILPIHLMVNTAEIIIDLSNAKTESGRKVQRIEGIRFKKGLNSIRIQSDNQTNPHKDLGLSGLTINLK